MQKQIGKSYLCSLGPVVAPPRFISRDRGWVQPAVANIIRDMCLAKGFLALDVCDLYRFSYENMKELFHLKRPPY